MIHLRITRGTWPGLNWLQEVVHHVVEHIGDVIKTSAKALLQTSVYPAAAVLSAGQEVSPDISRLFWEEEVLTPSMVTKPASTHLQHQH